MEILKLLNFKELFVQIISFLVLLVILRHFLWKRFLVMLDDRKARIKAEFDALGNAKNTIEKLKMEYNEKILSIDLEAKKRIDQVIKEAQKSADAIREKADIEGMKIINNAKDIVKDEFAKAREELKKEVVNLTIEVAEKLIQDKLSEEQDKKIVEMFLKEIAEK